MGRVAAGHSVPSKNGQKALRFFEAAILPPTPSILEGELSFGQKGQKARPFCPNLSEVNVKSEFYLIKYQIIKNFSLPLQRILVLCGQLCPAVKRESGENPGQTTLL